MRRGERGAPLEGAGAAVLGALQTWAFVDTRLWWLPLLCIAALAARARRVSPRRAAWLGLAFGSAWLAAGTWWLYISLHRYGGLPAALAVAAVAALALLLSGYLAAALALYARWRNGGVLAGALLFGAVWLLAELARGVIFTGFPWLASGYAQVDGPLATLAPWVGVYGIGMAVAMLAALTASGWRGALAGAVILVALAAAGRPTFSHSAGTLRVALVQTNVPQDVKFDLARVPETLAQLRAMLFQVQADLVVAPETALPLLPPQLAELAPGFMAALGEHFAVPGRAALIGAPLGGFEVGYTNSVIGLSDGPAYRYDKSHLVPFGEFIPAGFRWFTDMMQIPLGDFTRGALDQPSFAVDGQRVAPNICYEDLFGEELARRFTDPARAPTIFANVSNIAWFGATIAIPQHLNISRLRSLEFERPMLRATNTGATAAIDYRGRVVAALPSLTRAVLQTEVEGRSGMTPFARWSSRFGLWPLVVLAFAVVLSASLRRRR